MVLVKASNGQMLFKKQDTSTYGNSNYITTVGPLLPTACSSSATKTATSSLPVPAPCQRQRRPRQLPQHQRPHRGVFSVRIPSSVPIRPSGVSLHKLDGHSHRHITLDRLCWSAPAGRKRDGNHDHLLCGKGAAIAELTDTCPTETQASCGTCIRLSRWRSLLKQRSTQTPGKPG